MNSKPLVSVLIPVYNRGKYFAEAIESILHQSYKNWELIISDDCSTDNSLEIAHEYEKKDKRISVYQNAENLGQFRNRNKVASYAKGKYLKYLDSDDILYFFGLELLVKSMEAFPEAGFGVMSLFLDEGEKPYPILFCPEETYNAYFSKGALLNVGPSGCIFKADVFRQLGGFKNIPYAGDTDFMLTIGALHPCVRIQKGFFFWRVHPSQQFREGNASGEYEKVSFKLNYNYLTGPNCPLKANDSNFYIKKLNYKYSRLAAKNLVKFRIKEARSVLHNSSLSWTEAIWNLFVMNSRTYKAIGRC